MLVREHHWRHPVTQDDGYIDLITGYGRVRAVVECKRAADSIWVFLLPSLTESEVHKVRVFCTERAPAVPDLSIWADLMATPQSHEAQFCTVRGQDQKEPMLERIADGLLRSLEAVALEELALAAPAKLTRGFFVPFIVTAATLQVARFDPSITDIATGKLPDAEFQDVPYIRFRKGLAQPLASPIDTGPLDLRKANLEKERTVFVVTAGHLQAFLANWSIKPLYEGPWPQEVVRAGGSPFF
ncbi:MAG TPA: hypothetical protein VHB47_21415 [Thermoanaerobaculia bacterium]|nr:hypothetical protein [Thermoanaerobaculia bacterium]